MDKSKVKIKDKNILYIGPKFFGYEVEIKKTLEYFGAKVDFYDDRPSEDFFTKVFIRLKLKFLVNSKIESYYDTLFNEIKDRSYDYVFVIAPETLNYEKLSTIKDIQKTAKYILYMWDSFKNKDSFNTIELFNRVITFDSQDARKYNLDFLALFYIQKYEKIKMIDDFQYDICFTATAHSDRYQIVKKIEKQVIELNKKMFSFFYLPSKIMYWMRKLFIKKYAYGNIDDFSFSSLNQKEIVNIIEQSKVVLDINHPLQYGLTSRTIESLGAKRKLITTNENIKEYDFYNENNILIIDRNNPFIQKDFFQKEYIQPVNSIYQKYSLKSWIRSIFSNLDDKK